ncbi:MAG TPA: hypothetical protein VK523_10025 [Steroidobacteraceae bacterium]|nr:hypothetical protein [Steroidobacteraceae bacterium]
MTDNGGGGTVAGGAVGTEEVSLPQAASTDTAASTDVFRMILDDLLRFWFRDLAMFILCM